MSKQVMLLAGLVGLAILGGCAPEPVYYHECRGNNCNREHSDSGIVSELMLPTQIESVRPAG